MSQHVSALHTIGISLFLTLTMAACQNKENKVDESDQATEIPLDTVDSTVFASVDSLKDMNPSKEEFIPQIHFGYYRAYTPPSFLLNEKGEKTIMNGSPVQVPATINYIQINSGKVYGIQMAQGQQFLFTGFYEYGIGSTSDKGVLNLALDGRYLKTGKPVGPWNPQINYSKSDGTYTLTLAGTSGAQDSKMEFIAPDISTSRMQELMKSEESKLK